MQTNSRSNNTSPLNIGVIGAGWPGRRHADGYRRCDDTRIVAISDLDDERRRHFAERYGADRQYGEYENLLADETIDAVSVALPNFLHRPATVAALEAGKHVLCEKPPARTLAEAEAMREAAAREGLVLAYGLQRRFNPATQALREHLETGTLGDVYHARAVWTRTWGVPEGAAGWFTDPERAGGGVLIDIGVHVLDLGWYLMGCPAPATVSGQTYNKFPDRTRTEDSAFALIRFEDGRTLQLETSWILAQEEDDLSVHLYGTEGGARLGDRQLDLFTVGDEGQRRERPPLADEWDGNVEAFVYQARNFAGAVRGHAQPRTPAAHGSQLMALLDAVYQSADEEQEVAPASVSTGRPAAS